MKERYTEAQQAYIQAATALQEAKELLREAEAAVNKLEDEKRELWVELRQAERLYSAYYDYVLTETRQQVEAMSKGK